MTHFVPKGRNAHYWTKKDEMAAKAKEYLEYINENYKDEIALSIKESKIFDPKKIDDSATILGKDMPYIKLLPLDTVSAVSEAAAMGPEIVRGLAPKICALNFASYKNPGGYFLGGSIAQEEAICHESTLYPVLTAFEKSFYEPNRKHLNKALYYNRAIYSPDIVFEKDNLKTTASVLTCAAPNFAAAEKYQHVSKEENTRVLKNRIKFVLDIMEYMGVDIPILGAFGCGVFGQDPTEVAELFKAELDCRRFDYVLLGRKHSCP